MDEWIPTGALGLKAVGGGESPLAVQRCSALCHGAIK